MKILVTGHKGFIGSEVYSLLSDMGHDVTGYDIGYKFPDEKFDYIAHFAARTLIRLSKEKPYEYFLDDQGNHLEGFFPTPPAHDLLLENQKVQKLRMNLQEFYAVLSKHHKHKIISNSQDL